MWRVATTYQKWLQAGACAIRCELRSTALAPRAPVINRFQPVKRGYIPTLTARSNLVYDI